MLYLNLLVCALDVLYYFSLFISKCGICLIVYANLNPVFFFSCEDL